MIDDGDSLKKFKPTQPEPFALTKPKIKALPQPIMIPKVVKSKPMPENLNKKTLK